MDETQPSPVGLVCPRCKHRLYAKPPLGDRRRFWESQPLAYTLDGKPCFVYSQMWNDYRIRSLYFGGELGKTKEKVAPSDRVLGDRQWIIKILKQRGMMIDDDRDLKSEW